MWMDIGYRCSTITNTWLRIVKITDASDDEVMAIVKTFKNILWVIILLQGKSLLGTLAWFQTSLELSVKMHHKFGNTEIVQSCHLHCI